jgi:hypothetical protein
MSKIKYQFNIFSKTITLVFERFLVDTTNDHAKRDQQSEPFTPNKTPNVCVEALMFLLNFKFQKMEAQIRKNQTRHQRLHPKAITKKTVQIEALRAT